ncbi:MAG: hypothetical protein CM15mP87_05950 [Candidatus Neomarinimicrobiota bacterium]|nr:MAG: hypothetical protein CM15mP87_05950 [Candidatus Neomarinimicrobiota bacterium]
MNPGRYTFEWDGKDLLSNDVASGVYFYELRGESFISRKKMLFDTLSHFLFLLFYVNSLSEDREFFFYVKYLLYMHVLFSVIICQRGYRSIEQIKV